MSQRAEALPCLCLDGAGADSADQEELVGWGHVVTPVVSLRKTNQSCILPWACLTK